jgi:endonuclease/exonuclease/phosphatase family metal-dependent hydrolase
MHTTVSFFNCFLRTPNKMFGDGQCKRANALLQSIHHWSPRSDIIGLCELWRGYEQVVADHAKLIYGLSAIVDNNWAYFQNSGLCLLYDPKRYYLIKSEIIYFEDSYLLDSFARKGFMSAHLRDRVSKRIFAVIITHLNDTYRGEYAARVVQEKQLWQIRMYMHREIPHDLPYIIMGDFNIDFRTNTYAPATNTLLSFGCVTNFNTPTYFGGLCSCDDPDHVHKRTLSERVYDYILTKNLTSGDLVVHPRTYIGITMSDHAMVSTDISIV